MPKVVCQIIVTFTQTYGKFTQRKMKTYVHMKTCTQTFMAALFIIAKTCEPPRRPSVGEWINKLCIQTMEHSWALKRHKLSKPWKAMEET